MLYFCPLVDEFKEMVRFLAERDAETPEAAQDFDRLGYRFSPAHSTAASYVFLREGRAN